MPSRSDITYFGAGPSALPTDVLEKAAEALVNFNGTGLSLVEQSHRSALSASILADATKELKHIAHIPDTHEVLYMQGGGTTQFSAVVYNLVSYWAHKNPEKANNGVNGCCEYLVTGGWSSKAADEAKRLVGEENVNVVFNAKDCHPSGNKRFGYIPEENAWRSKLKNPQDSAFVYFCDNETVDGVEWPSKASPAVVLADENRLVVADMSSNILSRTIDVSKYALIFAGAQKNIGSTGITIVIIRKDILDGLPDVKSNGQPYRQVPITPIMMHYPTIFKNGSLYNTLPIFDVYIASLTLKALISTHGGGSDVLEKQEQLANNKAFLVYNVLDEHPDLFHVVPEKGVRSRMNICFNIKNNHEEAFIKGAESTGLLGLKGHRSVGGVRVSNYNAIPLHGIERLVTYMKDFAASRR